MSERYHINEGVVIKRHELTNGDLIATLLGPKGKWQAKAKKGKQLGGNLSRLSLFHDVTVQYYRKRDDDLAILTQVTLNGALPNLSSPEVYPYVHVLAELVDALTVDIHVGESIYSYFVSALRGLSLSENKRELALVYAWKLLHSAGLSPRVSRCVVCSSSNLDARFDIAMGGLSCVDCKRGLVISEAVLADLRFIQMHTVRDVLAGGLQDAEAGFVLLSRYLAFHVAELKSLDSLKRLTSL